MDAAHIALTDRYQRLLTGQAVFQREVSSAARRAAADEVHAFGDLWARWRCDQALTFVTALTHQVQRQVPDGGGGISRSAAAQLRMQARDVEIQLRGQQPPVTFTTEAARAEVIWLRQLIVSAGERLHAGSGTTGLPCRCAGCELIRSMDDVTIPGAPDLAPRDEPAVACGAGQVPGGEQPVTARS